MKKLEQLFNNEYILRNPVLHYFLSCAIADLVNRNMDMFASSDDAVRMTWNSCGVLFSAEYMLNELARQRE